MNRYLVALLALVGLSTLYGVINPPDFLSSTVESEATPTAQSTATNVNVAGLEGAGENVLRQTSPFGLERLAALQNSGSGTPIAPTAVQDPPPAEPEPAPAPAPQVIPETPPQEPIPALW